MHACIYIYIYIYIYIKKKSRDSQLKKFYKYRYWIFRYNDDVIEITLQNLNRIFPGSYRREKTNLTRWRTYRRQHNRHELHDRTNRHVTYLLPLYSVSCPKQTCIVVFKNHHQRRFEKLRLPESDQFLRSYQVVGFPIVIDWLIELRNWVLIDREVKNWKRWAKYLKDTSVNTASSLLIYPENAPLLLLLIEVRTYSQLFIFIFFWF